MMVPIPSWLKPSFKIPEFSTSGSHITSSAPLPRISIGPGAQYLEDHILRMYWDAVRVELSHILLTLRKWHQTGEFASTILPDEDDLLIHGYDTFLDQLSESSRSFHARYYEQDGQPRDLPPTYEEAMRFQGLDMFAERNSDKIRQAMRQSLGSREIPSILERRARMLLQSVQFLDIDKVIEYREPEKLVTFWKRPAPPQLCLSVSDQSRIPVLTPQRCFECNRIIRGSSFSQVSEPGVIFCETCYRKSHHGQATITKAYKTCCLAPGMTLKISRQICNCTTFLRRDKSGRPVALWPLPANKVNPHVKGGSGKVNCGLFELTDMVAEAKYAATRMKADGSMTLETARRSEMETVPPDVRVEKLKNINTSSVPEFGSSFGVSTASPEDVPLFLRSVTEKYPYGNVHMALRIGPIVIENGVENTGGGVLITAREPSRLQTLLDSDSSHEHSLILSGSSGRHLYSQQRPRAPKRYKAMMKQVVGGAFCGFSSVTQEKDIINLLIHESLQLVDEGLAAAAKATLVAQATDRLFQAVQAYLNPRVQVYISNVARKLLDPATRLRWDFQHNNCQNFCDSLIDRDLFGSFMAPIASDLTTHGSQSVPLYLISFVCRPGAYVQYKAKSKFDVPNGLTEEYLLKFRYGRHEESDIIDSLAEYWYDWGGFEGPVYKYQDVFPWDCTEAYGRYPTRCGADCNLSKHALAFPFDSWSIISLHLARGREMYPRHPFANASVGMRDNDLGSLNKMAPGHMSDLEWFRNRLTILLAQDSLLTAAVAMVGCAAFRRATAWLHQQEDEHMDRLKLGGIHRAQPFSHHFEKASYHQYFVADWASLALPLRVEAYEHLRDWRATRVDVDDSRSVSDDSGGGCGGFACGAAATGCAAGCQAGGGNDTCGSNCVTSCGAGAGAGCGSGCGGGGGCGGCGGCGG